MISNPDGAFSGSFRDGNTETLSFANPKSGEWQIEVEGYRSYSNVFLTANLITPTLLSANTSLPGLAGITSSETFYRVAVPQGAGVFTVSTSGGIGDVDLLLRKGFPAVCQPSTEAITACLRDSFSATDGNSESISINSPAAGDWYIDLLSYEAYGVVTLNIAVTFPALTLESGGVGRASTLGTGNTISSGYATASVNSGPAPFGTAVFSLSQNGYVVSEAGIPASPPSQNARIFIDYRTRITAGIGTLDINTGLAIANRSTASASLTYTLRDSSGLILTTGHGTLGAGAHRSKFVHELKDIAPDWLARNFNDDLYGSLEITSSLSRFWLFA